MRTTITIKLSITNVGYAAEEFDNLVDMQRHELVCHVQQGNVPKEKD